MEQREGRILRRVGLVGLVLLQLALSLGSFVAASEAPEPRNDPVVVDRDLVISGSRSGYIDIRVPRTLTIDARLKVRRRRGPNRHIDVKGPGRFVGIAIVESPYPGGPSPGRFFSAGRFAECGLEACDPRERVLNYTSEIFEKESRIKPGEYRLYLINDGAASSVTLRFLDGEQGMLRLVPRHSAPVDLKTPTERQGADIAGQYVASAGSHFQGGAVGFSLGVTYVEAQDFGGGADVGICQYNAAMPPPEEIAYGPHCSALVYGLGSGVTWVIPPMPDEDKFVAFTYLGYNDEGIWIPNLDGTRGLGMWVRTATPIERFRTNAFFLPIE